MSKHDDQNGGMIAQILAAPTGTLADIWGGLVGDWIARWRIENAMAATAELRAEAERRGLKLDLGRVPERFAVRWFEVVQEADEPDLRTIFVRLLAGAADEAVTKRPDHRLLDVVSGLTSLDARVFRHLYDGELFPGELDALLVSNRMGFGSGGAMSGADASRFACAAYGLEADASLETLRRLGLVEWLSKVEQNTIAYTRLRFGNGVDLRELTETDVRDFVDDVLDMAVYIGPTNLGMSLFEAIGDLT